MLTANRVQQFLDSAREWDAFLRGQAASDAIVPHRLAVGDQSAVFEIDLPGYEREELNVEVEGKELLISASKDGVCSESEGTWKVRERHAVPSEYRFEFPFLIDAEKTEVHYENGTVRIYLEKPEAELPRKLEVK